MRHGRAGAAALPAPASTCAWQGPVRRGRQLLGRGIARRGGTITYTVQPGDSLALLAARFYGDPEQYRQLWRANHGRLQPDGRRLTAPEVIQPGWRLLVPLPSRIASLTADGQVHYVVQAGDTLSGIAAGLLGDWHSYRALFAVNRGQPQPDGRALEDPALLQPGWVLRVPADRAQVPHVAVPRRHPTHTRPPRAQRQAHAHQILGQHLARATRHRALVILPEPAPPPRLHPHIPARRPAAPMAPLHLAGPVPSRHGTLAGAAHPTGPRLFTPPVAPPAAGPAHPSHTQPAPVTPISLPARRTPRTGPTVRLPDGHLLPMSLVTLFLGALALAAWRRRRGPGTGGGVPWRLTAAPLTTMARSTIWPGMKGWLEAALSGRVRGDETSPLGPTLARLEAAFAERSLERPRVRWVREGHGSLEVALLADADLAHVVRAGADDLARSLGCTAVGVRGAPGGILLDLEQAPTPPQDAASRPAAAMPDPDQDPACGVPPPRDLHPVPLLVPLGECGAGPEHTVLHVNLGLLSALLLISGPAGDAETLLVTLLSHLVGQADPTQLQLLISAQAGRLLDLLRPLPHLAAPVVDATDRPGLTALLDQAETRLVERIASGGSPDAAPSPALVLVVSGVEGLLADPLLAARLDAICRNGPPHGIHVLATADDLSALEADGALLDAFPARLIYGLVDGSSDGDMDVADLTWASGQGAPEVLCSLAPRQGEAREMLAAFVAADDPDPSGQASPPLDARQPEPDHGGTSGAAPDGTLASSLEGGANPGATRRGAVPAQEEAGDPPVDHDHDHDVGTTTAASPDDQSGPAIEQAQPAADPIQGALPDQTNGVAPEADQGAIVVQPDGAPVVTSGDTQESQEQEDEALPSSPLTLRLLGESTVEVLGVSGVREDTGLPPLQREFLAFLALQGPRHVPWMEVAAAFWPEAGHDRARNNFHQKVSQLRLRLEERLGLPGEAIISPSMDGYLLNPALVWVDALDFTRLLDEADAAADEDRVRLLRQAVELYRGDLLGKQAPDWAQPRVQDLRDHHLDALWDLSKWAEEHDDARDAVTLTLRLVRFDPTREVYHRRLMELYARVGDLAAVERTYAELCALLRADLDVPPSEETKRLYSRLRERHAGAAPLQDADEQRAGHSLAIHENAG